MKRLSRALLIALPIALGACDQSNAGVNTPAVQTSIPALQAPSVEATNQFAHGFEAGNLMSAHHIYVFFDPQCPHCGEFWKESKLMEKDVHFTWIPVGVLNEMSTNQGAAILKSAKPVDTMNEHEQKLMAHLGGMDAPDVAPGMRAVIDQNTKLLASFGATGVPYLLSVNAQTGKVFTNAGGMPAAELDRRLGWPVASAAATPASAPVKGK